MFEIEKNVPLKQSRGRKPMFPLEKMDVGDSFAAPIEMKMSVYQSVYKYGKLYGKKFSTQVQGDKQTVRCWRIA